MGIDRIESIKGGFRKIIEDLVPSYFIFDLYKVQEPYKASDTEYVDMLALSN